MASPLPLLSHRRVRRYVRDIEHGAGNLEGSEEDLKEGMWEKILAHHGVKIIPADSRLLDVYLGSLSKETMVRATKLIVNYWKEQAD